MRSGLTKRDRTCSFWSHIVSNNTKEEVKKPEYRGDLATACESCDESALERFTSRMARKQQMCCASPAARKELRTAIAEEAKASIRPAVSADHWPLCSLLATASWRWSYSQGRRESDSWQSTKVGSRRGNRRAGRRTERGEPKGQKRTSPRTTEPEKGVSP